MSLSRAMIALVMAASTLNIPDAEATEVHVTDWDADAIESELVKCSDTGASPLELIAPDIGVRDLAALDGLQLGSVRMLDLSRNPLVSLAGLESIPQLRQLHLCGVELTASLLATCTCKSLLALNLSEACIQGVSVEDSDSDSDSEAEAATPDIATAFPALVQIDLSHCDLSDVGLIGAAKALLPPGLAELILDGNAVTDTATLKSISECVPSLKSISVRDTPMLEEASGAAVRRAACAVFSELDTFNGEAVSSASSALKRSTCATSGGATDVAIRDISSCSCLEGEPCVDPENCANWMDRFKIAALRRKA